MTDRLTDEQIRAIEERAVIALDDCNVKQLSEVSRTDIPRLIATIRSLEAELLERRERERSQSTWYLLFGGESEDGRGEGKYIGRTTDVKVARQHYRECRSNPYSTGSVRVVTETEITLASDYTFPASPKEGASQ